ncbi:MAG: hypothetical protein GYA87_07120, partial [Christensenellaceae bacterium]|nr:hypothetical protein [Christensenellaceae bacterium]
MIEMLKLVENLEKARDLLIDGTSDTEFLNEKEKTEWIVSLIEDTIEKFLVFANAVGYSLNEYQKECERTMRPSMNAKDKIIH